MQCSKGVDLSRVEIENNLSAAYLCGFAHKGILSNTKRDVEFGGGCDLETQHVVAFFKPTARATCSHCHEQFFHELNRPNACRHHKSTYVCRPHPCDVTSIGGCESTADGLGYYCDGNESKGWPAKFWDCCGSEDENELGCEASFHTSY